MGPCAAGIVAKVMPDNVFYQGITAVDAKTIVEQHIKSGEIISHLLYKDFENGKPIVDIAEIEYFKKQTKIVLRNCGNIDPLQRKSRHWSRSGRSARRRGRRRIRGHDLPARIQYSRLRSRRQVRRYYRWRLEGNSASPPTPRTKARPCASRTSSSIPSMKRRNACSFTPAVAREHRGWGKEIV